MAVHDDEILRLEAQLHGLKAQMEDLRSDFTQKAIPWVRARMPEAVKSIRKEYHENAKRLSDDLIERARAGVDRCIEQADESVRYWLAMPRVWKHQQPENEWRQRSSEALELAPAGKALRFAIGRVIDPLAEVGVLPFESQASKWSRSTAGEGIGHEHQSHPFYSGGLDWTELSRLHSRYETTFYDAAGAASHLAHLKVEREKLMEDARWA